MANLHFFDRNSIGMVPMEMWDADALEGEFLLKRDWDGVRRQRDREDDLLCGLDGRRLADLGEDDLDGLNGESFEDLRR